MKKGTVPGHGAAQGIGLINVRSLLYSMMKGDRVGRGFFRSFNKWNLNKKISVLVTSLIAGISIIILAIFSTFYISSYINQSNQITESQLSRIAANYKYNLDNYKELAEALLLDKFIQSYIQLKNSEMDLSNEDYYELVENTKSTLRNTLYMYTNLDFIAVVKNDCNDILFKAPLSSIQQTFNQVYPADYADSFLACERGTLRMSLNDSYQKDAYKINIYMPIYSVTKINVEYGMLCMLFDPSAFFDKSKGRAIDVDSDILLIDSSYNVFYSENSDMIGTFFTPSEKITGDKGFFNTNKTLYSYQRIEGWNYYVVSCIPLLRMYRNILIIIFTIIFTLLLLSLIGITISKKVLNKTYKPIETMLRGFNAVAEGDFKMRISSDNMGVDFVSLVNGFNYMVEKIDTLMNQVILEQQQLNQIQFNELQSKIQPHFLYNTLECIHWQAIADGNNKASVLVQALSNYYRNCLSKGEDIISLENELEQIDSYLTIQNMRYDDIIHLVTDIPYQIQQILIPKMTLQPIIENALYHGIRVKEGETGRVTMKGIHAGRFIYLEIADDGIGMEEEKIRELNGHINDFSENFGYGIRNVNRRIKILFGEIYGLEYFRNDETGITVRIKLPNTMGQGY